MEKEKFHLIIDMGHGSNTPGKCAPDKSFYEWKFSRKVGKEVGARLAKMGYNVHYTWLDDREPIYPADMMLRESQLNRALMWRVERVNELCAKYGTKNCASVSIHANASGDVWDEASGYCVMVGKHASGKSKRFAQLVYDEAYKRGLKGNRCVPDEHYWVQGLAMCDRTNCPAILTENMFYSNKKDLEFLKSEEGVEQIIQLHIDAIVKYVQQL